MIVHWRRESTCITMQTQKVEILNPFSLKFVYNSQFVKHNKLKSLQSTWLQNHLFIKLSLLLHFCVIPFDLNDHDLQKTLHGLHCERSKVSNTFYQYTYHKSERNARFCKWEYYPLLLIMPPRTIDEAPVNTRITLLLD